MRPRLVRDHKFFGLVITILVGMVLSASAAQEQGHRDEVIKYMDEVWNKGNLAYIDQLMDPEVTRYGHTVEGNTVGIEAYKKLVNTVRASFTDYSIRPVEMMGVGNTATFTWQLRGNYIGADKSISPGRAVDVMGKTIWTFRGNKVIREVVEMDSEEYYRQIKMALPYSQVANRAMMLSYLYEVMATGDVSALGELVSDKHVLHTANDRKITGKDGLREHVLQLRTAFPDIRVKIHDVISEGNIVSGRWTLSGTWRGEWNGLAPSNRPVTATGLTMMRIQDGKIQETWSILELLTVELRP